VKVPDQKPLPPTELSDPPLPLAGDELDRIPERIGAFRILDVIARGMAVVYKAEQTSPKRLVALKIPRGGRLLSAESRKRFLREMELAARLHHSSIVTVLEAGEVDGVPFYTMPFIDGRSLAGHVVTAQPSRADRLELFRKICAVVQALHAEGLIHRDLKPENILIDRFGDVRLLDFGLARALAENDGVSGHQLIGTLQYMAPEQTEPANKTTLTPAADVYALGMMLYQLLTDALPYKTDGGLATGVATIRNATIAPPSQMNPDLGADFDPLVMACLDKNPARRPKNAGAVAAALQQTIRGSPPGPRRNWARVLAWTLAAAGLVLLAAVLLSRVPLDEKIEPVTPVPPSPDAPVVEEPVRMELVKREGLDFDLAPPGGESLPKGLWAAYSHAQQTLRETYDYRRNGALLVSVEETGELRWRAGEGDWSARVPVMPDQAAVLYAPGDTDLTIEWTVGDRTMSRREHVAAQSVRAAKLQ
jgi:tRNA A-37 threonylcarbamoyl transferase component Bud32